MYFMVAVVILVLVLVAIFLVTSLALARSSKEVESARDTEYVELDGSYIRYRITGDGPPLLLVHGWLLSSRIWDRLAEQLADRFTVYSLDLKGFGESDKPLSGYGVRHGGRLLYLFCSRFGLNRATVVGHDIGGGMAVKLAVDHPEMVGNLVLLAVPADEEQVDLPTLLWLTTLPVVGPAFYALGQYIGPLRSLWLRPFVLHNRDLPGAVAKDAGKSVPAAVRKTHDALRQEVPERRLVSQARGVGVPVLLVAGEEDQIVDPESVEAWAGIFGRSQIHLIRRCGHLPMVECHKELGDLILGFVSGETVQAQPEQPVLQPEIPKEEPREERTPPANTGREPKILRRKRRDTTQSGSSYAGGSNDAPEQPIEESPAPSPEQPTTNGRGTWRSSQGQKSAQRGSIYVPDDLFDWPESYSSRTRKDDKEPPEDESGEEENTSRD